MPIITCRNTTSSSNPALPGRLGVNDFLAAESIDRPITTTAEPLIFDTILTSAGPTITLSIPNSTILLAPNHSYYISVELNTSLNLANPIDTVISFLTLNGAQYTPTYENTYGYATHMDYSTIVTTGNASGEISVLRFLSASISGSPTVNGKIRIITLT